MGYQSKTYSLSDEVIAWIEKLRKRYGSPNKGLLVVKREAVARKRETSRPARTGGG